MDPGVRDRDQRQDRERAGRPARAMAGAALCGERRPHRHCDHRMSNVDLAPQTAAGGNDREEQQVHAGERPEHALVVGERSPARSRHRKDGSREHRPGAEEGEQQVGLGAVAVAAQHGLLEVVEPFENRLERKAAGGSLGNARRQPPGQHAEHHRRERERMATECAALAEQEPQEHVTASMSRP